MDKKKKEKEEKRRKKKGEWKKLNGPYWIMTFPIQNFSKQNMDVQKSLCSLMFDKLFIDVIV